MELQGWSFEEDRSVGIWGHWIHEDCTAEDAGAKGVEEEIVAEERVNAYTVRYTYRLTCLMCGVTTEVTQEDYAPEE